jgi:hypothetical protein
MMHVPIEPEIIAKMHVYEYHFIDDPSFLRPLDAVLKEDGCEGAQLYTALWAYSNCLKKAGWEGDGELTVAWVPPFVGQVDDNFGLCVVHVKQSNNGTSWIASEKPLPFRSTTPALKFAGT